VTIAAASRVAATILLILMGCCPSSGTGGSRLLRER
jgi:hypothetical protein